jgi:molybdopterin molybdotransferase
MLTVEEALSDVVKEARPLPPAERSLLDCRGCLLAEHVAADADQPPFDKSLVDGYALRVSELSAENGRLKIGETILAGHTPTRGLEPREAALIMTGAPLPAGADAVVMREHTRCVQEHVVVEPAAIEMRPGHNILRQGRICRQGEILLQSGKRLSPTSLGLLASVGRTRVRVIPRPTLAILPTGDELVEPGKVPGPGQIRNSSAVMLEALANGCDAFPTVLPIAADEAGELHRSLEECLTFDVLLVTGGVSAGQRDLVPAALERSGVRKVFHKVRVKPGKPLWFGIGPQRGEQPGTLVFGLPGNPASTLVGFLVFVEPALRVLAGQPGLVTQELSARLDFEFLHRSDRATYRPARWVEPPAGAGSGVPGVVEILDWAGSADLLGLARADGFVVLGIGDRVFQAGEIVRFLPLR